MLMQSGVAIRALIEASRAEEYLHCMMTEVSIIQFNHTVGHCSRLSCVRFPCPGHDQCGVLGLAACCHVSRVSLIFHLLCTAKVRAPSLLHRNVATQRSTSCTYYSATTRTAVPHKKTEPCSRLIIVYFNFVRVPSYIENRAPPDG